jgi:CSLREA domain-containing protein
LPEETACQAAGHRDTQSDVRFIGWIAAALLLSAVTASAATFTVDSTVDDVDVLPGDGLCRTAADACTLRAAIQETNALTGPDRVVLPPGTYVLTLPGAQENGGATGDLDVTGTLELVGSGATSTIVDAARLDRVIEFLPPGLAYRLTVTGLTLQHGSEPIGAGGGLFSLFGDVSISDCIVQDNLGNVGGGLYFEWAADIVRTIVRRNVAIAGGGLRGYRDVTITESTITDNYAHTGLGGGIFHVGDGELHIDRSTISGNHAVTDGGGIATASEEFVVTSSTISGNEAGRDGGGIWQGAIYDEPDGGVDDSAPLDLRNVTIVGNRSDADGNGTGDGGGIYARGITGVLLRNAIVAGNVDDGGEAPDCGGTAVAASGRNLVQSTTGCTLSGNTGGVTSGIDPALSALADHGGPTLTHAPLANSPVIDAASELIPGTAGPSCEPIDQRGRLRPQGARCDLGAHEVDGDLCGALAVGCTSPQARGAKLGIKTTSAGTKLAWSWRGAIPSPADLGTPLAGTNYVVCVYETVAGAEHAVLTGVLPGGTCDPGPCWKPSADGFTFKNHAGTPSGFVDARLRGNATRPGSLALKARGPSFLAPTLPLGLDPQVVVQLKRMDAPACWEARFSAAKRNDGSAFTAQSE